MMETLILYMAQTVGLLKILSGCGVILGMIWYGAVRSAIMENKVRNRGQLKVSLIFICICLALLILIPMPEVAMQILYYVFG